MKPKTFKQLLMGMLIVIAAIVCFLLGWWQWDKYSSHNGTLQNLGYAAQWPVFGGFFIYFYLKFNRLSKEYSQKNGKKSPLMSKSIPTEYLKNTAFQENNSPIPESKEKSDEYPKQ